ncbi:MAG: Xaa-Pro peptidase family protein [Oscillospiraceae bacterium]
MKKIEKLMSEIPMDIDAVMITSDINRRYFSGMKSSDGVILAFHEKAYLIIDFRYIEKAREVVADCDVILQSRLSDQLQNFCKEHNVKKIAVEADTVTISALDEYKKILPKVEFDTKILSEKIKKMRIIKTPEEILKIKSAQKIAENAFDNVLNFINVGKTEKEIAFALDSFMLQNGAEALSFDTIALAGKNTSLPHGVPSDKKVQNGDFVLMDFGAVFDGYHRFI